MKPVLIAGIGRCGTSYLYLQMIKNYGKRVIYEPLNLFILKAVNSYLKLKDFSILKHLHQYFEIKDYKLIIEPYIENFDMKQLNEIFEKHPLLNNNIKLSLFYDEFKIDEIFNVF